MIETPYDFHSHNTICRGILYTPDNAKSGLPCIVMGHGFALTHASGLMPFKEAFCKAGYAVFAFDYRHFGESDGEPRQALNPWYETEDWLAAIYFVRQLDRVDKNRICLWGTSFSGGLVIVAAVKDGHVQCTISQCPMMDGMAAIIGVIGYAGVMHGIRLTYHATIDWLRRGLGMSPNYIQSAGRPGDLGMMTAEDSWDGYVPILASNNPNKVAAGVNYFIPFFRPTSYASQVNCPALVLICNKDTVAPASAAERAVAKMPNAEVKHYPVGHFDVYVGDALAQSLNDQLEFLGRRFPV
jgi:pimeloyl-ACP methyl ester carboxylesterase